MNGTSATPKRDFGYVAASPDSLESSQNQKRSRLHHEPLVDVNVITETVMLRVNEQLLELTKTPIDPALNSGELMAKFMVPMISAMTHAITQGVSEVMKKVISELHNHEVTQPPDQRMTQQVRILTYKNDKLEQYTRRENVRINGVSVDPEETAAQTQAKAIEVMRKTGADISDADISACHRVGKQTGQVRPIIVRFVSRAKRQLVMKAKKNLKGVTPKVYMNDDLTTLRARLLGYVKGLTSVDSAWTIDGRIFAKKKLPPGLNAPERPVIIESPDDLFRLGEDSVDLSRLGLGYLQ